MHTEKETALETVLREFSEIAAIPRPSHHEQAMGEWLRRWAATRGISCVQDQVGTVIMDVSPSAGCERAPRIILQAHMDMVCVAEPDVAFDFLHRPIEVCNDGVTLWARGTSLGADNGIGMALCLYLLEDPAVRHGPLRAIFTTNEEDGMNAAAIDPVYLEADYFINLD